MSKCDECEQSKTVFVPHPQDESMETLICMSCAEALQYEKDEITTGQAIEKEERLCL